MSDDEVCLLQNACDIFVSLHRSEGFGLNIAECMLLEKAVVATGFSGNVDFMTSDSSFLIPYKLVPVGKGDYPYGEVQYWAEPSHEAAVETLRSIASNYGQTDERRSNAKHRIEKEFSLHSVGERMANRLRSVSN
jgi:glycosyltransferase involved in cell wall biosynthesis